MKMNSAIFVAAAAMLGTIAHESAGVGLSGDAMGDVLLYPFYSVENGNDTYISVTNNTDYAKALRVRFQEAMGSAEVLSFNLYLAPHDHWAGAVTADAGGGAKLISADQSCTYPAMPAEGFIFHDQMYKETDDEIKGIERTREGMVEIIEMGVLDDNESHSNGGPFGVAAGLGGAILPPGAFPGLVFFEPHPPITGCEVISLAWLSNWGGDAEGYALQVEASRNIGPATGGLSGYGVILNVSEGTNATYDSVALENFFENQFLHAHPQSSSPALTDAEPVTYDVYEGRIEFESGIDAVSAILMSVEVKNEVVLDKTLNAATDWVVSFPTRHFYPEWLSMSSVDESSPEDFPRNYAYIELFNRSGVAREVKWNASVGFPPPFSDYLLIYSLAMSTNVWVFGEESVLFPSERIENRADPQIRIPEEEIGRISKVVAFDDNGWAILSTYNLEEKLRGTTDDDGHQIYQGLPMVGFAVQKYVNGNVNGILSNYAMVTRHSYTRDNYFTCCNQLTKNP